MTNETDTRIRYIYRITNTINGKIYIGQSVDTIRRWYEHKREAAQENPSMLISRAIKKYGNDAFEFEVIAGCKTWEDANWAEEELIKQYDSLSSNGKGYNISLGGEAAPKSEEWKRAMRDWHASLSSEERAEISRKQSEATLQQIAEKGHPSLGKIRSDEARANMSAAQQAIDRTNMYTEEVRQKMSESHIGITDSEETKAKKSESAKEAWEKRIDYSRKCEAPGCHINGKAKYKIIEGVRYCNKHGLRMLRYGRLDSPRSDLYVCFKP